MRQKARWRQCTMSSGPQSNATSTGPSSSAESANPTIAATSTAASAVADHSLGKNASWLRLSATSAPSNSTGHTDGNGEPVTATATAAIAATAKTDHEYPRTRRDPTPRATGTSTGTSRPPAGSGTARSRAARSSTPCDPLRRPLSIPVSLPRGSLGRALAPGQSNSTSPMLGAHPRRSGTGMSVRDRHTRIGPT